MPTPIVRILLLRDTPSNEETEIIRNELREQEFIYVRPSVEFRAILRSERLPTREEFVEEVTRQNLREDGLILTDFDGILSIDPRTAGVYAVVIKGRRLKYVTSVRKTWGSVGTDPAPPLRPSTL